MNYIIEANRFLNDSELGLYFSKENRLAVVSFACWLFEEEKETQIPTCEGCGAEKIDGKVTTHFHFCPVEKEEKDS